MSDPHDNHAPGSLVRRFATFLIVCAVMAVVCAILAVETGNVFFGIAAVLAAGFLVAAVVGTIKGR